MEDQAVVVRRSGDEKAVKALSQARRRVIIVRQNDLEEVDGSDSAEVRC